MDLQQCRERINEINEEMARLFLERLAVSAEVAEYKMERGMGVLSRDREQQILSWAESLSEDDLEKRGLRELFEQIMAISRKRQYRMMEERGVLRNLPFIPVERLTEGGERVVFQGAEGSYSEQATKRFFGEGISASPVATFRDAMTAIEEGSADFAVLPIENSTAGIVSENYDLLAAFENYIVGEQIIRIEHCLMAPEGASEETVRTVFSHPQSLMQCERFLSEHASWKQISMKNNAFAARKVAADGDVTQAAIAGEQAAENYGLRILRRGVNSQPDNSTRFIIVTNRKIFVRGAGKISLCLEVAHEPGSLYRMLSHIMYNGLNMTRIESRPISERSWEYRFFIDFEGNLADPAVRNALRGLRDESRSLRILGNY